jgi:hypothetical protein
MARRNVPVAEQFLHLADILAVFEQERRGRFALAVRILAP